MFINTYSVTRCFGEKRWTIPALKWRGTHSGSSSHDRWRSSSNDKGRQRHPGACSSLERPRNIDTILPGKGGRSCSRQRSRFHNQREGETKTLVRTAKDSGKGSSGLIQKPWGGVSVLLPPDCEWIWLICSTALNMSLHPLYNTGTEHTLIRKLSRLVFFKV